MAYMWQDPRWPNLTVNGQSILPALAEARKNQGRILEVGRSLDLKSRSELLVDEVLNTSAIEGEKIDPDSVRSSVAIRLGLPTAGLPDGKNYAAAGLVEFLCDATEGHRNPLSAERIHGWHRSLFPFGISGVRRITVGAWREGPMRVVSGAMGKEKVHFEAPPGASLNAEMNRFINWWQKDSRSLDGIVRAAMAHLYFVTIHPYQDGNGRIARGLTDMALAQDEDSELRLYSLSTSILRNRRTYYDILESTQKSGTEVSRWVAWFLDVYSESIRHSLSLVEKSKFFEQFHRQMAEEALNERQIKVMKKLLEAYPEDFAGGLTNKNYVSITKVSPETAKRDLKDLLEKRMIRRGEAGGRSTYYLLNRGLGG